MFCSVFSFRHPHDANIGILEVVPEAPYPILILGRGFFFSCCSDWVFFASLYSKLLIWILVSSTLLLIPCKLFFISVSISFLWFPWPFLSCRSNPRVHWAPLEPVFRTLHLIDCLSPFCLVLFSGALIFSFIWAMFLCLLILVSSLTLFLCIRYSCYDSLSWEPGLM